MKLTLTKKESEAIEGWVDEKAISEWLDKIQDAINEHPALNTPTGNVYQRRQFNFLADEINEFQTRLARYISKERAEMASTIFEDDLVFEAIKR